MRPFRHILLPVLTLLAALALVGGAGPFGSALSLNSARASSGDNPIDSALADVVAALDDGSSHSQGADDDTNSKGDDNSSGSQGEDQSGKDSGSDSKSGDDDAKDDKGDNNGDRVKDDPRDHDNGSGNDYKLDAPEKPTPGHTVNAEPTAGKVYVKLPGHSHSVLLQDAGASLPVGSIINARQGAVTVTAARGVDAKPQSSDFAGGAFQLRQRTRRHPITDLFMRGGDFSQCRAAATGRTAGASASRRRVVRRLWGSGHGRFRTHGRYSAASVRGTIWLTEDRCDGTLIKVVRGKVLVRDKVRHRYIYVRSGQHYLARAPRGTG